MVVTTMATLPALPSASTITDGTKPIKIPLRTTKVKTRALQEQTYGIASADQVLPTNIAQPTAKISVLRKSLHLFNRMLGLNDEHVGTTRWSEVKAALVDAGCSVVHKSGSIVTFTDVSRGSGTINLHRPHPDPCFNPNVLRAIGGPITRRLGWVAETFQERTKK